MTVVAAPVGVAAAGDGNAANVTVGDGGIGVWVWRDCRCLGFASVVSAGSIAVGREVVDAVIVVVSVVVIVAIIATV